MNAWLTRKSSSLPLPNITGVSPCITCSGKDQNSKLQAWFLLNADHFHNLIKPKSPKLALSPYVFCDFVSLVLFCSALFLLLVVYSFRYFTFKNALRLELNKLPRRGWTFASNSSLSYINLGLLVVINFIFHMVFFPAQVARFWPVTLSKGWFMFINSQWSFFPTPQQLYLLSAYYHWDSFTFTLTLSI